MIDSEQKSNLVSRSFGQPKRHLDELILAERGGEGGLFSVSLSDRDRVKGSGAVEGQEDAAAVEAGQVVRNVW